MITYTAPAVTDYGSLIEMTADTSLLVPGLAATTSQLSSPGGSSTPGGDSGAVAPQQTSGTETTPTTTTPTDGSDPSCPDDGSMASASAAGADASQVDCDTGDVADQGESGDPGAGGTAGSSGGGSGSAGGDDALPFTGFPAGVVAALGGAVTAAGVALKSAIGRNRSY